MNIKQELLSQSNIRCPRARGLSEQTKIDLTQGLARFGIKTISDGSILEIGFGHGEHLSQCALLHPNDTFIGLEIYPNGVARLMQELVSHDINNILLSMEPGETFIKSLRDSCLKGAYLLFPDPWPKKRHTKRRFVQIETVKDMFRVLQAGATWTIATDHLEYQEWIHECVPSVFKTVYQANTPPNFKNTPWFETRYERKAKKQGNNTNILYYVFEK